MWRFRARNFLVRAPLLQSAACGLLMWAMASMPATVWAQPHGICTDEDVAFNAAKPAFSEPEGVMPPQPQPRVHLQTLVADALERSHAVGAARLIADAAKLDVEETAAATAVQASLAGGFGPGGTRTRATTENAGAQLRATINLSQLLYDGGRVASLVNWRTQLAESARYGYLDQREQLALSTVALALERGRYRTQMQVYRQNVRKMSCLVAALDVIVRADRGRASELLQAQKALEQAELSQSQTQSMVRQSEIRLRRLVGDGLPPTAGLATVFANLPSLEELVADVERAHEVAALGAQARAASRFADVSASADKPQVRWAVSATAAQGLGSSSASGSRGGVSGNYSAGLMLSVPLLAPGNVPARDAARKRAQAAQLQQAEALESRRWRVADLHEQAQAAQDRMRRLGDLMRSSEQVRGATFQQWQQLGRRSLFDVMSAEAEHYGLRVAYVNALYDIQQINANLLALGRGVTEWLK